jgi:hypothetical protein
LIKSATRLTESVNLDVWVGQIILIKVAPPAFQKWQKQKEAKSVEWGGNNGKKEEEWNVMRGSLEFPTCKEYVEFVQKISEVYPYTATAPKSHIKAMVYMSDLLLQRKTNLGEKGADAISASFAAWEKNREDKNLLALIQLAADKEKLQNYAFFKAYVTNALTTFKNIYVLKDLAELMTQGFPCE